MPPPALSTTREAKKRASSDMTWCDSRRAPGMMVCTHRRTVSHWAGGRPPRGAWLCDSSWTIMLSANRCGVVAIMSPVCFHRTPRGQCPSDLVTQKYSMALATTHERTRALERPRFRATLIHTLARSREGEGRARALRGTKRRTWTRRCRRASTPRGICAACAALSPMFALGEDFYSAPTMPFSLVEGARSRRRRT